MAPERRLFGIASPQMPYGDRACLEDERIARFPASDSDDGATHFNSEEAAMRRSQAVQWMQEMLGCLGLSIDPSEEELKLCLRNGLVLCNLLNRINPGAVSNIAENLTPRTREGSLENVRSFLAAVEEMNLPGFEASDLGQGGSLTKVVDCILALRSYFNWIEGRGLSPWKYATPKPVKSSKESSYRFRESSTPKTTHSRKRWTLPEFAENTEVSYDLDSHSLQAAAGSPAGPHGERGMFESLLDSENLSYLSSPESTATRLHQIGQKFREVLQVKKLPEGDIVGVDNSLDTNMKGVPLQTLPLVKSLINDKQPDEVPAMVDFMMRKVREEFDRRLRTQQEQSRKLRTALKDLMSRESKLASRAKVLEALASGSGEEIKIVTQQLQEIKMEKRRLEDEKRLKENHVAQLLQDRDEHRRKVDALETELVALKEQQQSHLKKQAQYEGIIAAYDQKFKTLEQELDESYKRIEIVTTAASVDSEKFRHREEVYKSVIRQQVEALQESKIMAQEIKMGVTSMQLCWQDQLMTLEKELGELTSAAQSYHDVLAENRRLYNEVQDLKGNIRVYCRVRPFLNGQKDRTNTVEVIGDNGEVLITNPNKHGKDATKLFTFNKTYGPEVSQEQLFLDTEPLIRSVLDGYNVCIFAYGQTGSGKTYTMSGPSTACRNDWGVNNRALYDLFHICQARRDAFNYEVGVQMIEIYNEQVRDLLAADGVSKSLGIRSSSMNGLNVPDALMIPVATTADVLEIMAIGQRNRAVGATALNERSSRSHSVLTVHVHGKDLVKGCVLRGCLHLVDLAGSERVEKSEATGDRLKEAQHINKSLSALGDVISALAQKSSHIPYRNSKLTQLLQDSLGGRAKTLMFVHINPDADSYGETISTLKFAERVSAVELGAARTNRESGDLREIREQVATLKDMLAKKDAEIERLHTTAMLRSTPDTKRQQRSKMAKDYSESEGEQLYDEFGAGEPSERNGMLLEEGTSQDSVQTSRIPKVARSLMQPSQIPRPPRSERKPGGPRRMSDAGALLSSSTEFGSGAFSRKGGLKFGLANQACDAERQASGKRWL